MEQGPNPKKTSSPDMNGVYVTKPQHRRPPSGREAIDYMHHESPSHYQYSESPARRSIGESPFHRHSIRSATNGGAPLKPKIADSPTRGLNENPENGSSEHGTKGRHLHGQGQSPLHRSYQGRQGSKLQATSPARKRNASEGGGTVFAPLTPRRSKMGANTRPDETPDRSAPLPKFGDWNEKDPTSADDFTYIFNKRREEKQTGAGMVPATVQGTPSHISNHKQANVSQSKSSVWCCMAPKTLE